MLRPLTTGELLDRTFTLYRKNFLLFVIIAALPGLVMLAALAVIALSPVLIARAAQDPGTMLLAFGVGGLVGGLAYLFVLGLARGAMVVAVSSVYLGKPIRVAECLRQMKGRWLGASWVLIGTAVLIGMATLLLIIPGILLAVRWALALPTCILEDAGFTIATSRSSDLTEGKRWQVFLIYFLKVVLDYAATYLSYIPLIVVLVMASAGNHPPSPWIMAIWLPFYVLFQVLVAPFETIAFTLTYYDARVRKEALDLELLMEASYAPPAATAASAGLTLA